MAPSLAQAGAIHGVDNRAAVDLARKRFENSSSRKVSDRRRRALGLPTKRSISSIRMGIAHS